MAEIIFQNYPQNDRSYLIPLFQDIQNEYGYLPEDILREAFEHINLPFTTVYGVATFYN